MSDNTILDNHMLQYDQDVWDRRMTYVEEYFDEDAEHEQYMDEREENEEDE